MTPIYPRIMYLILIAASTGPLKQQEWHFPSKGLFKKAKNVLEPKVKYLSESAAQLIIREFVDDIYIGNPEMNFYKSTTGNDLIAQKLVALTDVPAAKQPLKDISNLDTYNQRDSWAFGFGLVMRISVGRPDEGIELRAAARKAFLRVKVLADHGGDESSLMKYAASTTIALMDTEVNPRLGAKAFREIAVQQRSARRPYLALVALYHLQRICQDQKWVTEAQDVCKEICSDYKEYELTAIYRKIDIAYRTQVK